MESLAVVDTAPLYAAADIDDAEHDVSVAALQERGRHLVIPTMVVAEATYLIGRRLGANAESRFLLALRQLDVEAPHPDDWTRIGGLVAAYADMPLGGTDASVVALAERLAARTVITLDRRHFAVIRPRHCDTFTLLP